MFVKIQEVSTAQDTGELYVLAHFWPSPVEFAAGDPPSLINDFILHIRPKGTRIKLNADGNYVTQGGAIIIPAPGVREDPTDPFLRETYNINVRAEVRKAIKGYVRPAREHRFKGDHSSANATGGRFEADGREVRRAGARVVGRIRRHNADPHGHLARPDIQAFKNSTFTETG